MAITIRVWSTPAPGCAEGISNQRSLRLERTTRKVRPHERKGTPQHLNIAVQLQPSLLQRFRPHIRRLGRIISRPLEPRGAMNGSGRPDPVVKDLVLIGGGHRWSVSLPPRIPSNQHATNLLSPLPPPGQPCDSAEKVRDATRAWRAHHTHLARCAHAVQRHAPWMRGR